MFRFRCLPWEYAVRNLLRRPLRSTLTLAALTLVIVLVFVVVGFVRGLEKSLAASGDPDVALVFALGMGRNLEYSAIPARTADLLAASVAGVRRRHGAAHVAPELYLATQVAVAGRSEPSMGLVRGVTPSTLLVRKQVEILQGDWPRPGEVLVGRLAAVKLGAGAEQLAVGQTLDFEGRSWRISGVMAACGSVFDAELWCRLDDLQQAMQRQDLSLVAVGLSSAAAFAEADLFCKERLDLELQAIREADYYALLQRDYRPVRRLAWLLAAMLAAAGGFAGWNTMHGAVLGRVRELATLQTVGFLRRAILVSLLQEGALLASAASLIGCVIAFLAVHGIAVRFTMGAFTLQIDSVAVLLGCGLGVLLGLAGAVPPALRAMRMPVAEALKAV